MSDVIHDGMPYDPIQGQGQGQGHGGPKWSISKSIDLLRGCVQSKNKTNDELWYSKTISTVFPDWFLIFILVRRHVTFKVTVYEEWTGVPVPDEADVRVRPSVCRL